MQECQNCERLLQRIADLNSELLVLKIAAVEAAYAARKQRANNPPLAKSAGNRKRGPQAGARSN